MAEEYYLALAKKDQIEYCKVIKQLEEEKSKDNMLYLAQALYIQQHNPKIIHETNDGQGHGRGKAEKYDVSTGKLWARFDKYSQPIARFIPNFQQMLISGEVQILDDKFHQLTNKYKVDEYLIAELEQEALILEKKLSNLGFTLSPKGKPNIFYDSRGFSPERIYYNGTKYNNSGYDYWGYDSDGYDRNGFDAFGYNRSGFNRCGYNKEGFDKQGYDREGYNFLGIDRHGFNRQGFNANGFDRHGFNRQGFDSHGFGRDGYNIDGYNRLGYDRLGYNRLGYNRRGFDREGFNDQGYNSLGFDKDGISDIGMRYNRDMLTIEGKKPDYYTAEQNGRFLRFSYKQEYQLKTYSVGIYVPDTEREELKERFSKEDKELSILIYLGKSFNINREQAVNTFNIMMTKALKALVWQCNIKGDIHLVSVPSSTVYRSGTRISYERGFVDTASQSVSIAGCNIINDNDLLKRTHDIESERRSHNRSITRQLDSIECTRHLSQDDKFILIDDIVTKGTILAACESILYNNGANRKNIYKLTLLATRGYNTSGDPFTYDIH